MFIYLYRLILWNVPRYFQIEKVPIDIPHRKPVILNHAAIKFMLIHLFRHDHFCSLVLTLVSDFHRIFTVFYVSILVSLEMTTNATRISK